jgi:hypothetical protein
MMMRLPNTSVPLSQRSKWTSLPRTNQIPHTYVVHHVKTRLLQAEASTNVPTPTRVFSRSASAREYSRPRGKRLTWSAEGAPSVSTTRSRLGSGTGRRTRSCGLPCRLCLARWGQRSRACVPTLRAPVPRGVATTSRAVVRALHHAVKPGAKRTCPALVMNIGSLASVLGMANVVAWPRQLANERYTSHKSLNG